MALNDEPVKNYQRAPGNLVFIFGGRFLVSKQKPLSVVTGLAYIIPSGLYLGFWYVYHDISLDYYDVWLTVLVDLGFGIMSRLLYRFCLHTYFLSG